MKRYATTKPLLIAIALFMLFVAFNTPAQTPNFNEMFKQKKTQIKYLVQQIAALQVYLERLKKGYEIVDEGLTTIGGIKDGKFAMDKSYLSSLKVVSPIVAGSPLLDQIAFYNRQTLSGLRALEDEINGDDNFSSSERDYISGIRERAVRQSKSRLVELERVVTPDRSEMTDDERLGHLEQLHGQFKRSYLFAGDLIQSTRLLGRQRAKERNSIDALRKLYGVRP